MNNEKEEVQTILDNCIVQLSELTVKLNVLTSMVLGVYSETLPKENFEKIAATFFSQLEQQGHNLHDRMVQDDLLHDQALSARWHFGFQLSIGLMREEYGLKP